VSQGKEDGSVKDTVDRAQFEKVMRLFVMRLTEFQLDLMVLQSALIGAGVISQGQVAQAHEKIYREAKESLDNLAKATPEKLVAILRGDKDPVQ
jgi:hypothetical protein